MRILIISQVFWPDSVASARYLADLAVALARRAHDVTVLSSRHAYENPRISFRPEEYHENIHIIRLRQTRFGRKSVLGRVMDYGTYTLSFFLYLMLANRKDFDAVIGTTSPPLSSLPGVLFSKMKKIPFCFWVMDLQPQLSVVAGYLRAGGVLAKTLDALGAAIIRKSDLIITLDRYMAKSISEKGGDERVIRTIPLWPFTGRIYDGTREENPFRRKYGFGKRLVVMYSGNHSVMHPLDTLLEAAYLLKDDEGFLFVFIGGGARKRDVAAYKEKHGLDNIIDLPSQDERDAHVSLGSADIHVVIQGDGCTGFTHPSKIYGAMYIGKPVICIGPPQSHIADILKGLRGNITVRHGQAGLLVRELRAFLGKGEAGWRKIGKGNRDYALKHMDAGSCISGMIDGIEKMISHRA